MLLRHSASYLLARGVPGIINFFALAVYTRLLVPEQYGLYAMVIAVISLVNVVLWQWLRLGMSRFLASYEDRHGVFLSTVALAFLSLLVFSACLFVVVVMIWPEQVGIGLAALSLLLLWMQAWFELNLELARSRLSPLLYGGLASIKAVVAIALGSVLAYLGLGVHGVLIGVLVGFALPALWMTWRVWRIVRVSLIDRKVINQLAHYGLPLTATFALGFIVNSSDRLIIGWLMDVESAGLYAVGYDLAAQVLIMFMAIINLAAYPVVVRKLEQEGEDAARQQLRIGATLMLASALPAMVAWVLLAPNIASVVLDAAYVDSSLKLMPIIAMATLLAGFQFFYFDMAFQLSKRTVQQIWVMLVAALINIVLNLLWIPSFGLEGAAYATLVAFSAGLICSVLLGRRAFLLPMPTHVFKIIVAVIVMAMAVWLMAEWRGALALVAQSVIAAIVYAVVLILFNVGGIQRKISLHWVGLRG